MDSSLGTPENRGETTEKQTNLDEIEVGNNGSCAHEPGDLSATSQVGINISGEINGKEIGFGQPIEMPSNTRESTSPASGGGSHPTTKGYGLKKWKRIRRESRKDGGSSIDLNRILKRGLSNAAEPSKYQDAFVEAKPKSGSPVASVNSSGKSPIVPFAIANEGLSSDYWFAMGSTFPVSTDSDNSEDQSSRSSTAASAPKLKNDMLFVSGSGLAQSKVENLARRSSSNTIWRDRVGKGTFEISNKTRGRAKVEMENSCASMESYSRSSNIIFTQGSSIIANGRHGEMSTNYNGENSDEAQASRPQSSDEVQISWSKENGEEIEDISQNDAAADASWEMKEEESENQQPAGDEDLLAKSIISLQAFQEKLRVEVEKFREIGKESFSLPDELVQGLELPGETTAVDPAIYEPGLVDQMHFEETGEIGTVSLEDQLMKVKDKLNCLERKLEHSTVLLKAKECRVTELEAILNGSEAMIGGPGSTVKTVEEKCREMEMELEGLFKQKVEAEVEYLVMTITTQEMKEGIALYGEEKSLAGETMQLLQELREAESRAVVIKRRAEAVEASWEEMLGSERVLKLKNGMYEMSLCFVMQLMLVFIALGVFVFRLLPNSVGVVPT